MTTAIASSSVRYPATVITAAPRAMEIVCGVVMRNSTAAYTRPCSSATQSANQRRGGEAAGDGARALDGGEDSDEGGGPVQPVADDGVADRLGEAEHRGGDRPRRDHVPQFDGAPDVAGAGRQLRGPAAGGGLRVGFPHAQQQQQQQGNDREGEGGGIDDGDDVRADGDEQARPD